MVCSFLICCKGLKGCSFGFQFSIKFNGSFSSLNFSSCLLFAWCFSDNLCLARESPVLFSLKARCAGIHCKSTSYFPLKLCNSGCTWFRYFLLLACNALRKNIFFLFLHHCTEIFIAALYIAAAFTLRLGFLGFSRLLNTSSTTFHSIFCRPIGVN